MRKNKFFIICTLLVLGCIFFNGINLLPFNILTNISNSIFEIENDRISEVENIYDIKFNILKAPSGNKNIYVPEFKIVDLETAKYYAKLFSLNRSFNEDDEKYIFTDADGTLNVFKYIEFVKFIPSREEASTDADELNEEEALYRAENYIQSKSLNIDYEEMVLELDKNIYTVKFINRIGNLKNYAFITKITMDKFGNILEVYYYNLNYEIIDNYRIKSMRQAYRELPVDFPEGTSIDLKKCQLVYFYENSIVQPAYLFEGEIVDGDSFECYVKAIIYK